MKEMERKWLEALEGTVEPWELAELDEPAARRDAFTGDLRFGTGGIRCLMGIGPNRMNRLTIGKATQGLAEWILSKAGAGASVVIGHDTRLHSPEFAEVTACVLAANGIHAVLLNGPQPTPVLDFAVRVLGCSAGVCITASHNPREYNGYKVYGPDGVQATDAMARAIQAKMEWVDAFEDVRTMRLDAAEQMGLVTHVGKDLLDAYHGTVMRNRLGVDCSQLKVVYSPLCGTGLEQVVRTLAALGVGYTLVESQSVPNGNFPECPKPNPENPDAMVAGMAQMVAVGADLFLATDPDADRVGVACMDGGEPRLLSGNEVGLLLFDYACRHRGDDTSRSVAVTTVVTDPLLDSIAEANGVELRRTLTGFKYVGEQIGLIERDGAAFLLGVEESDGYLRGSYVRDKDGICGVMLVCEVASYYKAKGMSLSDALEELYERYGYMLGKQISVELPGVEGRSAISRTMSTLRMHGPIALAGRVVERAIDYLPGAPMSVVGGEEGQSLPPSDVQEWRLAGGSRVLLRPSGTEPKLKAYVFAKGPTHDAARTLLHTLCDEVSSLLDSSQKERGKDGTMTHIVLLSGGSGTRLWPLSNSARSKQFLKVLRDEAGNHVSMVQRVFGQIAAVGTDLDVTIATSAAQADVLGMQVGGRFELAAEPERRDTAPAIMLACAHLDLVQGAAPDDPVIVMPIDTFADQAYYDRIPVVAGVVSSGASDLVLLGVKPTYPSEKYGYIIPRSTDGEAWPVETFREKPDEATAASYIGQGGLWNCGVFGFKLGWLRDLTRQYFDARGYDEMLEHYSDLPRNSFDYEVVERAESISVVPYSGTWKDLGTWNTLAEEMADPLSGRVWVDGATTSNVHAVNETGLPVVVAGISDAVVVATPDGILVTGKEASSHIKGLVEEAAADHPMYERRPWGEWRVLDESGCSLTRELSVAAGCQLPYVRRSGCSTTWTVVAGEGDVVVGGEVTHVACGDAVHIADGQAHAARAASDLRIVEVRVGSPVGEDDAESFGFFWE